jgi:holo-[acyl-carrier protein] synthase
MIVGLGMDLVDIPRIARMLETQGERAVARLFTPGEAAYAQARAEPARHFAARFAAKEAAYKALAGTEHARGIAWRDIEVAAAWDGRPLLVLHGRAAERARELGLVRAHLTLTHADAVAGAVVVLEGDPALAPSTAGASDPAALAPPVPARPDTPPDTPLPA